MNDTQKIQRRIYDGTATQEDLDRHARIKALRRFDNFDLSDEQLKAIRTNRANFQVVAALIFDNTPRSREQGLALTALEEAKYWTNQAIALHGVPEDTRPADPDPEPEPEPTAILALPITWDGFTGTIGSYLADLLVTLINEGEGFDSKRPFGNSGWDDDIEAALENAPTTVSWDDLRDAIRANLTGGAA